MRRLVLAEIQNAKFPLCMTLLRSLPSLKVVVIPTKFSNIFDDIGAKDTSLADALQDCEMMCISQKYIQLA